MLPDQLEVDRAHRALQPTRLDGLPRDIIVKLHYYQVKEAVMKYSQDSPSLAIQGQEVQIFVDLSPYTIQQRQSLKPLLLALSKKGVKYRWAFPFQLSFTMQNKAYAFMLFPEGECLVLQLRVIV